MVVGLILLVRVVLVVVGLITVSEGGPGGSGLILLI